MRILFLNLPFPGRTKIFKGNIISHVLSVIEIFSNICPSENRNVSKRKIDKCHFFKVISVNMYP